MEPLTKSGDKISVASNTQAEKLQSLKWLLVYVPKICLFQIFVFPASNLHKSEENKMKFITCRVEQEVNFTGNTFPTFTEPVSLQIGRNITISFTKKA